MAPGLLCIVATAMLQFTAAAVLCWLLLTNALMTVITVYRGWHECFLWPAELHFIFRIDWSITAMLHPLHSFMAGTHVVMAVAVLTLQLSLTSALVDIVYSQMHVAGLTSISCHECRSVFLAQCAAL